MIVVLACSVQAAPASQATRAAQSGSCITRLPVEISLPDGPYAAAYTKQVRVRVSSSTRIAHLRADLFTFSGQRMAASRKRRSMRGAVTLTLTLEGVFRPMQAGGYTLVLSGEPNRSRSCGPKSTSRVVRFRACNDKLPVTFPTLPSGRAADYQGFLSVPIRSKGPLIRDLRSSIYGFDGALLGHAQNLRALFGQSTLDHALLAPLQAGGYNVIVTGVTSDQPPSCGRAGAQASMTFR